MAKKTKKKEEKIVKTEERKEGFIERIVLFFKGVRSEIKRVHWLDKKSMVKYSIATIFFIIFCAVFFYVINVLFALVQSIFN